MAAPRNDNIKQQILNAASALLQQKAFSDISLADIARQSGVSKGTLYYYYNNKEDILFDVAERYLNRLAQSLLEWTGNPQKDTSLPRLLSYAFERGAFDDSGALRLYLIGAGASGHEALREKLVEQYVCFQRMLAEKLRERGAGEQAEYAAWLVLTVMDGILIQSQLGNPRFDAPGFIRKTVERLCAVHPQRPGLCPDRSDPSVP